MSTLQERSKRNWASLANGEASDVLIRLAHAVAILTIVLTPLYNIGEVRAFTFGGMRGEEFVETPLQIKFLKDLGILVVSALCVAIQAVSFAKSRKLHPIAIAYLPITVAALVAIPLSYLTNENIRAPNNEIFLLAGIRWMWPIWLSLLMVGVADRGLIRKIAVLCAVLFFFSVAFQVFQAFRATTWFGRTPLGLSARVAGIYLMPSTSGFFAALTFFLACFYLNSRALKIALGVLGLLSVWLSGSATGMLLIVVILMFMSFRGRYVGLKLLLVPLVGLATYASVGAIASRPDFAQVSGPVRVNHVARSLADAPLFSNQFGLGTNSAVLMNNTFRLDIGPEVLDSTYASILVNTGLAGVIGFAVILAVGLGLAWRRKRLDGIVFVVMVTLAAASQPFTEQFPMNFIFAIWVGFFVSEVWALRPVESKPDAGIVNAEVAPS